MPLDEPRIEEPRVDELTTTAAALETTLDGLDALEVPVIASTPWGRRAWSAIWPKLAALAIALATWQAVVASGWRPEYALAGPGPVVREFWRLLANGELFHATALTMGRAVRGYALAILVGTVVGLAIALVPTLRVAVGSLITGLQTMPSIAWFPLAILLFRGGEGAIFFVVVIGAAPSIANGIIAGVDQIPPIHLRVARVLGAKRLGLVRHVIVPAALPGVIAGLKQGWAFAWRSLLAGELLVQVAGHRSIGVLLDTARSENDVVFLQATMIAILIIGIVVDALAFGAAERAVLRRRGLLSPAR